MTIIHIENYILNIFFDKINSTIVNNCYSLLKKNKVIYKKN